MKKEWIRNAFALALLVGLVVFVSLGRKRTYKAAEKEDQEKKLAVLDWDKVRKMRVQNAEGSVVFVRRPKDANGSFTDAWRTFNEEFDTVSDWEIVEPYKFLPDYYTVKTLIDNVTDLTATKVVDEKGERPEEYLLKDPPVKLDLFEAGKAEPLFTLRVGDQNSAHSNLYVQTSRSPKISLAAMTLEYLKNRKPADWRAKEIMGFKDPKALTRVTVEYREGSKQRRLTAEGEGGRWQLTAPSLLPADEKAVESLVADIKAARLNDIVSENADRDAAKYGFDRPYAVVSLTSGTGKDAVKKTLVIGGKIGKDKDIYVRRSGFPLVFTAPYALKNTLTKNLQDWVDKNAFGLKEADVRRIVAVKDGGTHDLEKSTGVWKLTAPVGDDADPSEAASLVAKLTQLKAKEFVPDLKIAAGAKPWLTLQVSAGAAPRDLTLYETKDGKALEGYRSDPRMGYRFERTDLAPIISALANLRERRLMPFESEDLVSFELKKGSLTARYRKADDGTWAAVVTGTEGALARKLRSKGTSDELVRALESLRLTDFGGPAAGPPKNEVWSVEFRSKPGRVVTWSVGPPAGGKAPVRSRERNLQGQVAEPDAEEIPRLLIPETGKQR